MKLEHFKLMLRSLLFFALALCPMAQGQNFVKILAGKFTMGDPTGAGFSNETQHPVTLSTFYLATTETTFTDWKTVYTWALTHGYTFDHVGKGKGLKHPVQTVSWYDAVKWCNAKSEKSGRVPCYRVGADVYKTGRKNPTCNWKVNGYRLPTEAEWEKAARAGQTGKNFPFGDTITHNQANYFSDSRYAYDISLTRGYQPLYKLGATPYTSPAGSFPSYGGLKDMAGNVDEWCWDRFGTYSTVAVTNPRGATSGSYRIFRGGSWASYSNFCRASYRNINVPGDTYNTLGFRVARSL